MVTSRKGGYAERGAEGPLWERHVATKSTIQTTMKHRNKAAKSGSSPASCSPSSEESASLKRINAAKPGTLIKVRMWTDECGSSHETHAKSITAAVKIIRQFSEFNANWSLEFISEANARAQGMTAERKL